MLRDLRLACRRLRLAPGFTVTAVLTLAVAVGANTAILTIADAVLFRPLPFHDPDRVFVLLMRSREGKVYSRVDNRFIDPLNTRHDGLSEVGRFARLPDLTADGPGGADAVPATAVTPSYLRVLGVRPALGRLLAEDDAPGRAAMVSYATWRARFAGDPGIVGRTVTFGDRSLDVVGVLPRGFVLAASTSFGGRPDVLVMQAAPASGTAGGEFYPVVRLEPGVTREQAQAQIEALVAPVGASDPALAGVTPVLEALRARMYPVGQDIMRFLVVAAGLVLVIGCANIANILLARGRRQEREFAVRTALGASRLRLVRPLVVESLLIGGAASALALGVTRAFFEVLLRQVPAAAYGNAPVGLDARVVLAGLALGLGGGLLFAVLPVWRAASVDVAALIQGRRRGGATPARIGRPMLAAQVAVALVLVFGAVAASRAFVAVLQVPLGFDPAGVVRIGVSPPPSERPNIPAFYRRVTERIAGQPGVLAVGSSGSPPFAGLTGWSGVSAPGERRALASVIHITPGYLDAVGIPVLEGRDLTWDDADATRGAIVSARAARALFGEAAPIGRTVSDGDGAPWRVVGVAADVTSTFGTEPAPPVYVVPDGRTTPQSVFVRIQPGRDPDLAALRREVQAVAPGVAITVRPWPDALSGLTEYRNPRFQSLVLGTFAAVAVGLTALGIAGLVTFLLAARAKEMGIRLAIGASPRALVGLMVREMLWPVGAGLALGIMATRGIAPLARAQLFQMETDDPITLGAAAAVVMATAILAAWLPARRAARLDPLRALRVE